MDRSDAAFVAVSPLTKPTGGAQTRVGQKASALRSAWPARSAASSGVHPMARRMARTCPARRSHRSCPLRKATKPAECTAARVIDPAPRADYHGHGNRLGDRQGPVALLTHSYRHLAFLQKSDTGSRAHRSDRRGAVPKLEVSPNLGCCHGRVSRTSRAIRASGCGWVGGPSQGAVRPQ